MSKKLFCTIACVGMMAGNYSNAVDFNNKVYGKFNANVGYAFQGYTGDIKNMIDNASNYNMNTEKINHSIIVGAGFNAYYKLNNTINPFAGIYFEGKIPVAEYNFIEYSDRFFSEKISIKEVFNTQFRFGAKLSVIKDLSIQPYYLVGFNVTMMKYKEFFERGNTTLKKNNVGFTTGAGVEVIVKDRFTVGMDYRYGENKWSNFNNIKVKTHTGTIKLGVQF